MDAIESVFSNTNKVLIDNDNGNSLMYLPIDRLIDIIPINNKVTKPNSKEVAENVRARSGKLRIFRKIGFTKSSESKRLNYPKIELGL